MPAPGFRRATPAGPAGASADDFDALRRPLALGTLELPHRLVMAPLTRTRADADGTANALMAEYYAQRAGSAALIVSEATWVSPQGKPNPFTPGIATDAHRDGWRLVTDAVHERGGRIVAQLWHGGRIGHPETSGQPLVSASDVAVDALTVFTAGDPQAPIPAPRALTTGEIAGVIRDFADAAVRAITAGFDGVELHGANGYLLQQFLADNTNRRDDAYGGSPTARARFVTELTAAVAAAVGADRVGIRLSPAFTAHEIAESDGGDTYRALASSLRPLGLAYVHLLAGADAPLTAELRRAFGAPLLLNTGFGRVTERAEAISLVAEGHADAAVVGRAFIANPDLYARWAQDAPENDAVPSRYYGSGPRGYTDYPTLADV